MLPAFFTADSMGTVTPFPFRDFLTALAARRNLDEDQVRLLMRGIRDGDIGDVETAALLVAWRMKGETAEEIAAAAATLRENMVALDPPVPDVLDTCGTGGDGTGTFNISTAAALVAAGAGVPVVKHGNRAVSGKSGSAEVLESLGVSVGADPGHARRCLEHAGFAFCLASVFHPAWRQVGAVRRRLGVTTTFNCLGPLANPARSPYQLIGVGRPEWLAPAAHALARLGTRHALVVRGDDGLDEVSLSAPTRVFEVRGTAVHCREWTAADFGLEPVALEELRADSPADSAGRLRDVLRGIEGPALRVVLANAAAALVAAERAPTPAAGVALARASIRSGKARRVLDRLAAIS